MKSQDLPTCDAPLAVNEQVIVMSGHETIRVLEVEVDASLSSLGSEEKSSEIKTEEGRPQPEISQPRDDHAGPQNGAGKQQAASGEAQHPAVQTLTPTVPISVSVPQTPAATVPVTVQGCSQVLSQESLASLMTGMLAQTGSLGQPLLIPISMAGSIGGQGGLAVLTLPTNNVATLSGLATAATQSANLLKLPFAGLQAATVLNSIQPQLQTGPQAVFQSPAGSMQPVHTALQQPCGGLTSQTTPVVISASQEVQPTTVATQSNISVAALQTAGLSINPALINAASLGVQNQFLSSLTSSPIITNAMSNLLPSQILTTTQGQVIGTLPLLVNPTSLTGGAATPTLPLQGLQVQTVTPQLLLNNQGQIFAAVGNGAAAMGASNAVLPKAAVPLTTSKSNPLSPATAATQLPVVIAPQPSVLKSTTSPSSSLPITCGDAAKVGQLVSKPHQTVSSEEGINLEEIREFAKNFKIRRLSLGLTQTQVGQALTATEGPAYSQSAICRFEKLDITPKSAQKLKPVLEKWLAEAEHWNQKGQQNLMEFVGGEPSKKRKRRTSFTPQAIEVLNSYFEKNSLPTGQEITEIAKELNYDREVVRVWFCNRRQTLKNTSKINIFQIQ
ncbi:POU domain, class 6, transcription factor 1 isoform X1 [Corythoichthys intestinalis]|uniref:POU domain, class 6, transcription factor 1 isoform X1 n=2 Tax=Corythoichthys intestinalis TaxID=161448 RepID=UPI0025A4E502|nr:POU domain, class 6, transcription factor 1 isoform X1 [Corythoichthys intestinalis]